MRALRKIRAAVDFFTGHHVQGKRLVRDRLFQQVEAARRGRENTDRGRRQERDTGWIHNVPTGVLAGQSNSRACRRDFGRHPALYDAFHDNAEQVIGRPSVN